MSKNGWCPILLLNYFRFLFTHHLFFPKWPWILKYLHLTYLLKGLWFQNRSIVLLQRRLNWIQKQGITIWKHELIFFQNVYLLVWKSSLIQFDVKNNLFAMFSTNWQNICFIRTKLTFFRFFLYIRHHLQDIFASFSFPSWE